MPIQFREIFLQFFIRSRLFVGGFAVIALAVLGLASCAAEIDPLEGSSAPNPGNEDSNKTHDDDDFEVTEGLGANADDDGETEGGGGGAGGGTDSNPGNAGEPGEDGEPGESEEPDPADSSLWETENVDPEPTGPHNEAVLTVEGREFEFTLDWCFKNDEDLMAGGPGTEVDGSTKAFLSLDLGGGMDDPEGEARIEIGSHNRYEITDEFYAFGTHLSANPEFFEHAAGWFEYTGEAKNGRGEIVGEATLHFSCH